MTLNIPFANITLSNVFKSIRELQPQHEICSLLRNPPVCSVSITLGNELKCSIWNMLEYEDE